MIDEVDPQQICHGLVVALPGQLHESPAIIDLPGRWIGLAVRQAASLAVFLDRLHVLIRFMIGCRQGIGEPTVVISGVFRLPSIKNCIDAIDLRLPQVVCEQGSAHLGEKKIAVYLSHIPLP